MRGAAGGLWSGPLLSPRAPLGGSAALGPVAGCDGSAVAVRGVSPRARCCSFTPSSPSCSPVQSPELRNGETETYFLRAVGTVEGLSQAGPCTGRVGALWLLAQPSLRAGVASARAAPPCWAVWPCCRSLPTGLGSLRHFPRRVDFFSLSVVSRISSRVWLLRSFVDLWLLLSHLLQPGGW